jgi:hypothetical protein
MPGRRAAAPAVTASAMVAAAPAVTASAMVAVGVLALLAVDLDVSGES